VCADAAPVLVNVTLTVWLVFGVSGVAVPPYLLIVEQVDELDALALDVQVIAPGPTSCRITAAADATLLEELPMIACVQDERVPLTLRTSSSTAMTPAPQMVTPLPSLNLVRVLVLLVLFVPPALCVPMILFPVLGDVLPGFRTRAGRTG
jgi:DMSO reductase anchor subunit